MDAEEILARVRNEQQIPADWTVFPLLKRKVIGSIVGWVLGILVGGLLLALVVPIVIPGNYERGVFSILVTSILLGVLLFIFIGSICMLITDILRLRNAEQHVIVLTEEFYVKQEGAKKTQIPLYAIKYVTARGRAPIDRTPPSQQANGENSALPDASENMMGLFFGRKATPAGQRERRKRRRTPSSLAFIDERTNTEVVVVNDDAFGDPFTIGGAIEQHVASATTSTLEK
jgi:hypothetical protein